MKVWPEYCENIIVGVIKNQKLNWYVADRIIWFLDYALWEIHQVPEEPPTAEDRFGILVVDEAHEEAFLREIEPFRVTVEELRELFDICYDAFDKMSLNNNLLIDFDKKHFISFYQEYQSFEDYAPKGWTSEYRSFDDEIPVEMRYWIDENGVDLFKKEITQ